MTDGVGGQKRAMNLRLMRRLISERATSALTINLFPSPLKTSGTRISKHTVESELNPTLTKKPARRMVLEAMLHFQGLETRHLGCSQLPLMY